MKRALPAVALVALLLATAVFWGLQRPDVTPAPEPAPRAKPRVQVPFPTGRSVYHFKPPGDEAAEPDLPEEDDPTTSTSLDREVMTRFAEASNDATGLMYHQCLRPWREENPVDDAPLTINLVLTDGRVGDVEVISPFPLPPDLVTYMEDAVWSVPFPEAEGHRGEVKLQRSMSLTR